MNKNAREQLFGFFLGVLLLVILISVFNSQKAKNTANLVENGLTVEGVATKLRERATVGDQIMGIFGANTNCAISWKFTVDGQEYTAEGKTKNETFDQLDADQDGSVAVTVRYDPEKPQNSYPVELTETSK